MAKNGICTNFGNCPNADDRKVLTIQDGQEFVCPNPDCGKELIPTTNPTTSPDILKRVLYALGVVVLIGLGWGIWTTLAGKEPVGDSKIKSPIDSTSTPSPVVDDPVTDVDPTSKVNTFLTDFNYAPPLPSAENSVIKGVIELGATGFNSFIIRVDGQRNWKLEKAEFGSSLVYEHMATEEEIIRSLKEYIAETLKYGVKPQNIHFIASSGAGAEENVIKIMNVLRSKFGYVVNTVTAEEEAKYALRSVLPKNYENAAFVVDMGSSNTKISYVSAGRMVGIETFGSKYFQLNHTPKEVRDDIQKKLATLPKNVRSLCFIIGGVPYELAKQIRKDKERYNSLMSPNAYSPEGERQKAGLTIYSAIANATQCRHFVFDWDSNFSIGFLLSLGV